MPRRKSLTRRFLHHLLLLSLARAILTLCGRGRAWDEWDERKYADVEAQPETRPARPTAESAAAPTAARVAVESTHTTSRSLLRTASAATAKRIAVATTRTARPTRLTPTRPQSAG